MGHFRINKCLPLDRPVGGLFISAEGTPMSTHVGVIRTVAIPIPLFTHLKNCQRAIEEAEGRKLTNSQVLAVILRQHRDCVGALFEQHGEA